MHKTGLTPPGKTACANTDLTGLPEAYIGSVQQSTTHTHTHTRMQTQTHTHTHKRNRACARTHTHKKAHTQSVPSPTYVTSSPLHLSTRLSSVSSLYMRKTSLPVFLVGQ